jgi:kinesin family protein C1
MKLTKAALSEQKIAEYEEQIRNVELQRRKLHNLVQELRGNVRVFARVRPYLPSDGVDLSSDPPMTISVSSNSNNLKIKKPVHTVGRSEEYAFEFDKIFSPSASQESVFEEVSEFVQSALDGYNVCLFSYGQTGSGKVHTYFCNIS